MPRRHPDHPTVPNEVGAVQDDHPIWPQHPISLPPRLLMQPPILATESAGSRVRRVQLAADERPIRSPITAVRPAALG